MRPINQNTIIVSLSNCGEYKIYLTGYGETQVLLPDIRAASVNCDGIVRRGLDVVRRRGRNGRHRLGDITPRRHGVGTLRDSDSEVFLQRRDSASGGKGAVGGINYRDSDTPGITWYVAAGCVRCNKSPLAKTTATDTETIASWLKRHEKYTALLCHFI